MARPGDRRLADVEVAHVEIDDGVYYVGRDRDPGDLAAAWRAAGSAAGRVGAVTGLPDGAKPTPTDLRRAGLATRFVAVDAYDGEGVLCLRRSG